MMLPIKVLKADVIIKKTYTYNITISVRIDDGYLSGWHNNRFIILN